MKVYLIVGPPGSGKGTQSKIICSKMQISQLSTGDIFRKNIKNKTELGVEILKYINQGLLVPDELTDKLVFSHLDNSPEYKNGVLLDGYPRNLAQIAALEKYLDDNNEKIEKVIYLKISNSLIMDRLKKRAEIEGRTDDTEDVIRERINIYNKETEPIVEYYKSKNILLEINGENEIEKVTSDILKNI